MTLIQITKSGTVSSCSTKNLEEMHLEFDQKHCIILPGFLEPGILRLVQSRIDQAEFYDKSYKHLGIDSKELRLRDNTTVSILEFLLNDQKLFQLIEQITGCPKIGCFGGRVYRMSPDMGIYDAWHDDAVDNRIIAMSINLSTEVYSGGILQIEDCNSEKIVTEVANTGFGDALLIRIAPYLMHRVTEVVGKANRTAFAGFFHSQPVYKPIFKPLMKNKTSKSTTTIKKDSSLSKDTAIVRFNDIFSHYTNEQLLVFNPKNTVCYGLDPIGALVLEALKRPMTLSELKNVILNEYDVEEDKCEEDLKVLIQDLETNEIIAVKKEVRA